MAAIDEITDLAQNVYYSINGAENDDTGEDLTLFQDGFIRSFNLWMREYETEAYWNPARESDYQLATIEDTTTFSFELPTDYRSPIINQDKYLKFVLDDGTIIAKFKLVDPNQRIVDEDIFYPNKASFLSGGRGGGGTVILSRAPTSEEVGATIVLDVVKMFPALTRDDASVLDWIANNQVATLGVAKNQTLSDVTKVTLSPSFTQKYSNELKKAIAMNEASNETYDMQMDDNSNIGGIW